MGFIQTWFGFNGWKELSTRGSILATIAYRVVFVFGLTASSSPTPMRPVVRTLRCFTSSWSVLSGS